MSRWRNNKPSGFEHQAQRKWTAAQEDERARAWSIVDGVTLNIEDQTSVCRSVPRSFSDYALSHASERL